MLKTYEFFLSHEELKRIKNIVPIELNQLRESRLAMERMIKLCSATRTEGPRAISTFISDRKKY